MNQSRYTRYLPKIFVYILFSLGVFSAQSVFAQPTVVIMSVLDHKVINENDGDIIEARMKTTNPDFKYLKYSATDDQLEDIEKAQEIAALMTYDLQSTDRIVSLVISSHGNTERDGKGKNKTSLAGLGDIGEDHLSENIKTIFAPLRGRFMPESIIFFDSCKTFEGSFRSVDKRVKKFLQFFGIQNAQVFGAVTLMANDIANAEVSQKINFTKKPYWQVIRENAKTDAILISAYFIIGNHNQFLDIITHQKNTFTESGLMGNVEGVALILAGALVAPALLRFKYTVIKTFNTAFKYVSNWGYLLKYQDGKLVKKTTVNGRLKFKQIISTPPFCSQLFAFPNS